jgi:hypothetical protein
MNVDASVEKVLLRIKSTDSFGVLFKKFSFERIGIEFRILLEPSWASFCIPKILVRSSLGHPIIIEPTGSEPVNIVGACKASAF